MILPSESPGVIQARPRSLVFPAKQIGSLVDIVSIHKTSLANFQVNQQIPNDY